MRSGGGERCEERRCGCVTLKVVGQKPELQRQTMRQVA
jgi:hypothetical protein